ncbi:peptidoglycan D,D-transpeptidase FtsI family protein [Nocardioides insulae]|uniref:peptidoglycan D,D-transpeptidase FtsI family protein n=1 Tax=Nocardioides insulae TaxID=394734 RepID=UPI00041334EC|nr:penicillin-binding protein 2 [Nocardioides insulae]
MNKPIRIVAILCLAMVAALLVGATWRQFFKADDFADDATNRRVVDEEFSRDRGAILVGRTPVADTKPSDDRYEYQRTYPEPFLYAPVTGYYAYGGSITGVERSQNSILSGEDDRLFVKRLVDMVTNDATQGGDVALTIDADAQRAAYDALTDLPGDVQGAVVAIEPKTGKILANVTSPSFNTNDLAVHDQNQWSKNAKRLENDEDQPLLNRGVQTALAPGSTFKIVTAAAAISSGKYDADSMVPGGATYQLPLTSGESGQIGNEGRDCGSGPIPFKQAMENSCNTSFAALANEVGADAMLEQAEKFGFNQEYFDDLQRTDGESIQAISVFPEDMDEAQTGQAGIGQFDVRATPLQMAMVSAGVANQGVVMKPYLVDELQSADSEVLERTDPEQLHRALSAEDAQEVTDLMVATVAEGTAYPAAIDGIDVAGKTGTAQSGIEDVPPYAWFTSFAPAENAQVAVAVMIQSADIPREEIAGGVYGGPIAKAVMEAVIDE